MHASKRSVSFIQYLRNLMSHSLETRFYWSDRMDQNCLGNCLGNCLIPLMLTCVTAVNPQRRKIIYKKSSISDESKASLWGSVLLRETQHYKFMHIITHLWAIGRPLSVSSRRIEPTYTSVENNWHNSIFDSVFH